MQGWLRTFPCLPPLMPAPAPPLRAAIDSERGSYAAIAQLYRLYQTAAADTAALGASRAAGPAVHSVSRRRGAESKSKNRVVLAPAIFVCISYY
eukprot:COSAG02_NODE_8334_length_2610_cov_1.954998_5_plen_93_part_01